MSDPLLQLFRGEAVGESYVADVRAALAAEGLRIEAPSAPKRFVATLVLVASCDAATNFLERSGVVAPTYVLPVCSLDEAQRIQILVAGATDILTIERLKQRTEVETFRNELQRWSGVEAALARVQVEHALAGNSLRWANATRNLLEVAIAPVPNVLLHGETGTGKDASARIIHELGYTRQGEFVVVHCGAIVESLSGSELFGHRKGAFTGAERDRDGAFARANGGTLFLDEIAELKPTLQTELLRVLQDGTYRPLGDDRPRASRFRLVAATHKDLGQLVQRGAFRADLYYRIVGAVCTLPPLRERIEDIPQLSLGFLREILGEKAPTSLEPAVELCLQTISYPGNVRELKNVVRLAAARFAGGSELRLAHLPREVLQAFIQSPRWDRESLTAAAEAALIQGADFTDFVDAAKDAMVQAALRLAKGSSKEAATRIGVSERCVQLRRRGGAREDAGELTDRLSAAP